MKSKIKSKFKPIDKLYKQLDDQFKHRIYKYLHLQLNSNLYGQICCNLNWKLYRQLLQLNRQLFVHLHNEKQILLK